MDTTDARQALIRDLKAVTAARAELMEGTWTRAEMERANERILEVQAELKAL